jgi:signal transduction histidine kinase
MDRMSEALQITVLHVDDYAGSRHVVSRVLRQAGFAVVEATTGEDALHRAAESPHLIILDVHLPDMSGLEVCRRLRTHPATFEIPVLYLSATCVSSEDRVRGLDCGADAYLTEPFDAAELLATVRALLRLRLRTGTVQENASALSGSLAEQPQGLWPPDAPEHPIIADISHEFRTPLNSILTLTNFLLNRTGGDLTPEQDRQVTLIRKAASFLLDLGNDMLELTAIEAGTSRIQPTAFGVSQVFEDLRGILGPLLDGVTVALVFEEPPPIPPLYTDRVKVTQILRNFICNALKFTAQGEVRVSARAGPDGDTVVLAVTDTGIGIAPEDQERIFQKFGRVGVPVREWRRGVGIGLHLARELARLLGGRITVQSTPGVGSTFSVIIPRVYQASAQET